MQKRVGPDCRVFPWKKILPTLLCHGGPFHGPTFSDISVSVDVSVPRVAPVKWTLAVWPHLERSEFPARPCVGEEMQQQKFFAAGRAFAFGQHFFEKR